MSDFDLLIVGGGPVGLVAAIAAQRAGLSAVVIEQSPGLPEKACGEGLMPGAVRALLELGIVLNEGVEFHGIRFIDGSDMASASFSELRGRALSRRSLVQRLHAEARARGIEIWSEHTLRDFQSTRGGGVSARVAPPRAPPIEVSGRLLVAADGLRSPIRRRLGYELPPRYPPRFGLQRHFRCAPWSDWVEVHWHERAEAYVTPLGSDEVGVAVLTHGAPRSHDEIVSLFPELARKLAGARERGRVRGAGPLEQRARSVVAPGVALVGDAAGYLDALSGEGLALGFRGAVALVTRFAAGELWRYPRDHARIGRGYYALTHVMLALARKPRLRRAALRFLGRHPAVFSSLLDVAADARAKPASRLGAVLAALLRL